MRFITPVSAVLVLVASGVFPQAAGPDAPAGFVPLFNGRDLAGWKVPEGDDGHWKVVDGVIDYDARSGAPGDKHLWTLKEYKDFVLRLEWRFKDTPFLYRNGRILMPDGNEKLDIRGEPVAISFPDADSGILVRGGPQVNLRCWLAGSGELWSVRRNSKLPALVR